jgi:O-antigen/teichoic acid export membrane protein
VSGLYYLQALRRSGLYTGVQTAKLLVEVACNVYLMGVRGMGVTGFLMSMLIGEILGSLALLAWMLTRLGARVDWVLLAPVLRYTAPLVPVGLLQLFLHSADRRIVLDVLGQEEAGIYGFGYRIAYLVTNLVLGPFILTWQPWIFGIEDAVERAKLVARVGTYAVLTIAVASLGVVLFGRQAALLLARDPAFWQAYRVIPLVATGYVFWALYMVSQTPLFLEKRTGRLLFANLAAVALNVTLNYALVPTRGIAGAGAATLLTFAAIALFGMIASRRAAGVRFELGRLASILCCVTVGGVAALALDGLDEARRLSALAACGAKGAVLCALVATLWFAVLDGAERARFTRWVRARL